MILEGEAMLWALLKGLLELEDPTIHLIRDARLAPLPGRFRTHWTGIDEDPILKFRTVLRQVDAAWPIAPETGGILERLSMEVEDNGKLLLSSRPSSVRIAASKLETHELLSKAGVLVVRTLPLERALKDFFHRLPWVVKADDGAGCENTTIVEHRDQILGFLEVASSRKWVVQPLVEGEPMSLTALFSNGRARLLSVNRQKISREEGGFRLLGLTVNVDVTPSCRALLKAQLEGIAKALPDLWGLVGIDFLWNGHEARILEVNPRLTSAYPGLSGALGINPAALILDLARTGDLSVEPQVPLGSSIELSFITP